MKLITNPTGPTHLQVLLVAGDQVEADPVCVVLQLLEIPLEMQHITRLKYQLLASFH